MPDTTSSYGTHRRPLIRFAGALMMFLASILLATSVGTAQDSEDFDCADFSTQAEAQRVYDANNPAEDPFNLDADDDGRPCESLDSDPNVTPSPTEDDDSSVSGSQYENDDQQDVQTPQTGGLDLLLIAAGLLSVLGVMGIGFSYRRR